MKKLLDKILTGNLSKGRVYISVVGYVLGVLIVLLSLNVYFQFQELLSNKQSANFLMVGKQVKNISFSGEAFTTEEVKELEEQKFIKKVAPVYANQFGVWIDIDAIKLHTQAFAEAVPNEFIDIDLPLSWRKYSRRWDEESDFVPIIVSREMINLYNFSFALSNGTPQITDNMIYSLSGKVIIKGNGKKRVFNTAVVGLSERINSVLVPETFLKWANEEFAPEKEAKAHKVLAQVENRTDPKIQQFFSDRVYQVEESKLINQKNLSVLYVLLMVLVVFGIAFIVFSMTIIVSNFALLIAESKYEIGLLKTLGYPRKRILKHFLRYMLRFQFMAFGIAVILLIGVYFLVALLLQHIGFDVGGEVVWVVWAVAAMLLIITALVSYLSVNKVLK